MFKILTVTLMSSIALAVSVSSTKVDLNPTQKQFLKNTAIAKELSGDKISDEFKFQVYHNLKADADRQAWMNLASKWSQKDTKVTAYFDQFYVYERGTLAYSVRAQSQDGRIQVVVNDSEKWDVDPKNIYQSLKSKKTTVLIQKPLQSLAWGQNAFADEDLPVREQVTFAILASAIGNESDDRKVITPPLMDRDRDIEIKMGGQDIPTRDWEAKIKSWVGKDTTVKCSSQFSGAIDGKPYKAYFAGGKVTMEFKNSKYAFDPDAKQMKKLVRIKEADANKVDMVWWDDNVEHTPYKELSDKCLVDFVNNAFGGGPIELQSGNYWAFNARIDCINKLIDRGNVWTKISCVGGDCHKSIESLGSVDAVNKKLIKLATDFQQKYHVQPRVDCTVDDQVKCELVGTPPTGLPPAVLADYVDQAAKIMKEKKAAIDSIAQKGVDYAEKELSFEEQVMKTAQYVRSIDRCCSSDTCRVDMFKETKIQLLSPDSSTGIR